MNRIAGIIVSVAGCLACTAAVADALIVTRAMQATTIAEVYVEPDGIVVELEIGGPDIEAFADLLPDPIYEKLRGEPQPLTERVPRYFREGLTLRLDGGPPLTGRLEQMSVRPRVLRDEISGSPLPTAEESEEIVISATLRYPLDRRPATLSLRAPHPGGRPSATIGFVVYHDGVAVNDFRYLAGEPTLRFDWGDPFYSAFEARNFRRQYYAPMAAFLYVEPYEVRKEIVLRPMDLQRWVDLGLEGSRVIEIDEQPELKRRVAEFLSERNPLLIDGRAVEGTLDRIHFIRRTLRKTGVIDPPEPIDAISATLGVIFVYPVEALPDEVTLAWELFADRIDRVPGVATDEAGGLPYMLTPDDPVLRWQNFLKNPTVPGLVAVEAPPRDPRLLWGLGAVAIGAVLSLLLMRFGGAWFRGTGPGRKFVTAAATIVLAVAVALPLAGRVAAVSDDQAGEIVAGLLRNVYRAFDFREESTIYDTLERSVGGPLLTDIYLETRRSLEIENQGGARARVDEVEMIDALQSPVDDGTGFVARCTWNVAGSVGHWGHIHRRTNQYQADVIVRAEDGVWKIAGLELLQEERL